MAYTRKYKVGDHVFEVVLDGNWKFMDYTPDVRQRIEKGRMGELSTATPVRAGDPVPARTLVHGRAEMPQDMDVSTLDFSNYEPFLYEGTEEALFTLTVRKASDAEEFLEGKRLILKEENNLPWYHIYEDSAETLYRFFNAPGKSAGLLRVRDNKKGGEFIPEPGMGPYNVCMQLTTALMILYTYSTSGLKTLLMHASVTEHNGKANLFFGTSGTGKSTHSRLWLENIDGSELINDDNPVVRVMEDGIFVYGSPWSGKTPCYRNIRRPIRTVVKLEQYPENRIRPTSGLDAYASIVTSSSCIKWKKEESEAVTRTSEEIAMTLPSWILKCRPDREAALLCQTTIEK